jgi:hypothetical protein
MPIIYNVVDKNRVLASFSTDKKADKYIKKWHPRARVVQRWLDIAPEENLSD